MLRRSLTHLLPFLLWLLAASPALAQGAAFTCQGRLAHVSAAVAQSDNLPEARKAAPTVTAFASPERVRFAAPSSVVHMHLEVYTETAVKLFDFELKGGNVLDWHLQDGQAERLRPGAYLCVLTVKHLSGKLAQRLATVNLSDQAVTLAPAAASQLTAQQAQAVGPMEEDSAITVLKPDEPVAPTVMAHNGEEGQVIRGKGALSFRLGDFLRGQDSEQMRLSAEGNLGIGITKPQARLDVDGLIRASGGIVFPDGSVQFSAARRTFGAASQGPGQFGKNPSPGQEHIEPQAAGTGTLNFIAKWAETGGAGTLTNSAIFEANGNVGIGTTNPQTGLDYRNSLAAYFTRDLPTNPFNAVSALQLGLSNAGSRHVGVGPSFLFFGENSAGAKSFLGRVSGVWENPAAGAEAGAIYFQVRANSGDVNALTERMRITSGGNVGIGTSNPLQRLHVMSPDSRLLLQATSNSAYAITAYQTNSRIWDVGVGGSTTPLVANKYFIYDFTANQHRMVVDTNGNVGIGTTTPNAKLQVAGNATQPREYGGYPKAMIYVSTNGTIIRCYNGTTGASLTGGTTNTGCGFTVNHFANGGYGIDFGFQVNDRFISVTAQGSGTVNYGANFNIASTTSVDVRTFWSSEFGGTIDQLFMIIVY